MKPENWPVGRITKLVDAMVELQAQGRHTIAIEVGAKWFFVGVMHANDWEKTKVECDYRGRFAVYGCRVKFFKNINAVGFRFKTEKLNDETV